MKKVRIEDLETYEAPGHFGMTAMRIQGKEETGATKFWMGLSHFLPGGGAEWAYEENPLEKAYFVLEGELTVKSSTETVVLSKGDSLFLGPNEGRELINATNMPASMLVVVNYPE
jgi:glyoxylate utilization-related uncharacterized protein